MADVDGTDMLDRRTMALIGRSLALRGEFVVPDSRRGPSAVLAIGICERAMAARPLTAVAFPRQAAARRQPRSPPRFSTFASAPIRPRLISGRAPLEAGEPHGRDVATRSKARWRRFSRMRRSAR